VLRARVHAVSARETFFAMFSVFIQAAGGEFQATFYSRFTQECVCVRKVQV
jgi:hypothetical protein